ncbi:MAG: isopentenyl phosphate kinase [Candidatus Syntropharchaeia archaeon]
MKGLTILKIGGSVLTEKREENRAKFNEIRRIAGEISEFHENLLFVHGAGSFGHPQAEKEKTRGKYSSKSLFIIHRSVKVLNEFILNALFEEGVPAAPIHPLSCVVAKKGRIKSMMLDQIIKLLDYGILPVLHGDVVVDEDLGISILSGDQIVPHLAKKLGAERVGIGIDVDGVMDGRNRVIERITRWSFDEIRDQIGGSKGIDVTDGMYGKVTELLEANVPALLFNASVPGNVSRFLKGEDLLGTVVGK